MATQVRTCPKCFTLMWLTQDQLTYIDDNTVKATCPNCHAVVKISLVSRGANAAGPKMGH
ncbi:MAG: hypothetical protein U0172_09620 [Nitrospiraceae bacterium]